jgi:hypothetical protein
LQVPIDPKIEALEDIPYTVAFVMKKRVQIDNFNELEKNKRPPEMMIWDGTGEEIEDWLDKVFDRKPSDTIELVISDSEIG